MADTKRCPMCGKDNPAEAEVCQHCQAQLKPIIGGAAPTEPPASMPEGADSVDWLRGLSDDDSTIPEPTAENEPPAEDDEFLLNRISLSSVSPEDEEAPKQAPEPEGFALPADQEEEGNADWFAILEESSARKEQEIHILPEDDNAELDSWLDNLGKEEKSSPEALSEEAPKLKRPRSLTDRLNGNDQKESAGSPKDHPAPFTGQPESDQDQGTDPSSVFTSNSVDRTGSLMQWLDEETPFSNKDQTAEDEPSPNLLDEAPLQEPAASLLDLPAEPLEAADLPDWLQDAAPDGAASAASAAPLSDSDQDEDLPTWLLDDSDDTASTEPTPAHSEPFSPASQNEDLPNWLLEETGDLDTGSPPASDLTPDTAEPFSSDAQDEELPTWLLEDAGEPEVAPSPPAEPAAADPFSLSSQDTDLPDWLNDEADSGSEPEPDAAMPRISSGTTGSLLERLKAEEEASAFTNDPFAQEQSPESVFPFGGDVPIEKDATLDNAPLIGSTPPFADVSPPDESSPIANIPLGNGDDLPDWLSESKESSETAADSSAAFTASPFSEDASPFTEDAPPETTPPFDSSLPFEEAVPSSGDAAPFSGDAAPLAEDTDLPDWLNTDDTPTEAASPFISDSAFLDEAGSSLFGDSTPSASETPPLGEEPSEPPAAAPAEGGDFAHPLADNGLPDWMESEQPIEMLPDQPGENVAEEASEAQLPGWLAAMRPVEAVSAESEGSLSEHVEKSGPLAGLRGVLPADSQTIKYRKPPVYSSKLKVSESQASHAGLLEDLLQRESKPSDAKRVGLQGSKRLMQLVVAVVLIVVLLLFRGAGNITDNPGRPYLSSFATAFHQEIEDLPNEAPVLLAVDYDPGYSGEMKAASSSVIKRLMSKRQRISVISTVPAGPALAEDLLLQSYLSQTASGTDYMNTHTINLGYLPGGVTSLREFSLRPQQAARYGLTTSHDGLIPWDHPALTGVSSLTDFAAVIVITDSVESGRAWVEQVQPSLGSTPMLLISSAQSAPMMEAYVQSGQLSGMLSGLAGSVTYENLLGQPGTGNTYWVALQGGLAVVIALILVGIILELFVTLVASRRTQSEA